MGLKLSRETLAPGLPVHNNEANKNDRLNWKWLGGLGVTIITLSGFFIYFIQRTWSSGNFKLTVARYAASSNVAAGNQDAVHSASSASRSKDSWTITELVGMGLAVVLVVVTMGYNYYLYLRTTKDRKNENKEKEEAKKRRRDEEETRRRAEKVTDRRERMELERRQEDAKDQRQRRWIQHQRRWIQHQRRWIQHGKFRNLDLSAKGKSELPYNSTVYERLMQDLTLRDDEASTSESKEQV